MNTTLILIFTVYIRVHKNFKQNKIQLENCIYYSDCKGKLLDFFNNMYKMCFTTKND